MCGESGTRVYHFNRNRHSFRKETRNPSSIAYPNNYRSRYNHSVTSCTRVSFHRFLFYSIEEHRHSSRTDCQPTYLHYTVLCHAVFMHVYLYLLTLPTLTITSEDPSLMQRSLSFACCRSYVTRAETFISLIIPDHDPISLVPSNLKSIKSMRLLLKKKGGKK